MKLLFRHKDSDCIVDKDYFGENDFLKIRTDKGLIYWNLESILDSEEWDVIPENAFTHEELDRIYLVLWQSINQNGDAYFLGNTLSKIQDLMNIYDIDGMNILS